MQKNQIRSKIYTEDFDSLEKESLTIDYLKFNLQSYLDDSEIKHFAEYFNHFGFSSYIKSREKTQKRTPVFDNIENKPYEVTFVLHTPYFQGTHLEFAGVSGNQLYSCIKEKKFDWNLFKQYGACLSRIDTCYDRIQESTDKINNDIFFEATFVHFKNTLPNNNIEYRKNKKGQLIAVGHRTSAKYYRMYLKSDYLRFEFEHKHRKILNLYDTLLQTKQFKQLEQRISYEFFKQTYQLFKYAQESEKVEWLAIRLRPFQIRNNPSHADTTIKIQYLNQCSIQKDQKVNLIKFFHFLAYLNSLDNYKKVSKYRQYQFPVRDFLTFTHPFSTINHSQLSKAVDFFNSLKRNTVLEFLSDKNYQMLVTIHAASVSKNQNQWIAQVLVADELFDYSEPFLFTDYFRKKKMTTDEFSVLFQILQNFSVPTITKEFDVPKFLRNYYSKLNGERKQRVKRLFLRYIKILQQEGKIQDQVLFPYLSTSNPNRLIKISDLKPKRLMEPFLIFEALDVQFVSSI